MADRADEDARTDVADAMLKAMIPMNQTRFGNEDSAKLDKLATLLERVVLAGSAVTACLLPWPQDIVELYQNEGRQLASIWDCLASLSLPTEILRKIDAFSQLSYNAKLAVNEALFNHFHSPRTSTFFEADLDLFFIANDAHADAEQVSRNVYATFCDIISQRKKVDLKCMVSASISKCSDTWIQRVPDSDGFSNKPEKHIIRYRGRRGKMSTRFRNKDARGWTLYKERHVAEQLAPRHILRTTNSITIVGLYPIRHAQLMLNVLRSKDELMLMCDQDCTAVTYDGTNVYANPRSLRAFNTRTNFVEARHLEENARVARMQKYGRRGFNSLMLEICKHYPRCDVKLSKKYCEILKNAPMRATASGANFMSDGAVIEGDGPRYIKSREDDYSLHYEQARVPYENFRFDAQNLNWTIEGLLTKQRWKDPAKRLFQKVPDGAASNYEEFHAEITKPGDESGRFGPLTFKHVKSAKASNVFQFSLSFESCYMCGETVPAEKSDDVWRMPVCTDCNDINVAKRNASANLNGKFAVVTGARIKIGQQAALKLLRCGATVHATTRFPLLLLNYFKSLPDSEAWWDRLFVHGLDFRNMNSVLEFCAYLNRALPKLDILIQNAAQTIQRTAKFNDALYGAELALLKTMQPSDKLKWRQVGNSVDATSGPYLLKAPNGEDEDESFINVNGRTIATSAVNSLSVNSGRHEPREETEQQIKIGNEWDISLGTDPLDSRSVTTWTQSLTDVSTSEIAEVMIINSIAPTLLMQQLLPLLSKKHGSTPSPSFVVNVSSREGIFNPGQSDANGASTSSGTHPHTNMAKAALNRLTQTCAGEFLKQGVYVTAVDPGWVSWMTPQKSDKTMVPPLTEADGAARVLDPVFVGLNDRDLLSGVLLRNFKVSAW
ncbi:hypothetical protein HDU80_011590 [Chytriomyces hyalinus]|nr:hypothetical protein HDU80_011590 [Chytriomyces hyalinus]